jgi:SAM-dependent methyltransferase
MTVKPADFFEYYTDVVYWNDFKSVRAYLNELATGSPEEDWMALLGAYAPAKRLLSLNCGSGWVERDIYALRAARSVVGIDISPQLVQEARVLAGEARVPADYLVMDANTASLDRIGFDYVLNHAALHHVAYLDRLVREVRTYMPPDGLFINYDYIGPRRNQYSLEVWTRMIELWEELPPSLRGKLDYPHLPTMLATDPTEAIHSDLIVETLGRYFDFVTVRPLGGTIAYQLLWNNKALHQAQDKPEGQYWLDRIVGADREYTQGQLDRSLFAFILCRPKPVLSDEAQIEIWAREEAEREARAKANGGRYQPKTTLEIIHYG